MNMKRWMTGAAAAVLLVTMAAGCGESGSGGGGTGSVPIDSISLPEKLDSDVIKILGYAGWEGEHEEIRQILKEAYGATVEYTVLSDWKENENKIATELASGNSYDLVISGKSLYDKKLVQPLDSYFDLNDPIFKGTSRQIESQRFSDGKLYGITSTTYPQVILYNKTIMENNGLQDPLQTYKEGNWNFSTFMTLCKALASEQGTNGKRKYAFSSWDPANFLTANGTYYVKAGADGKTQLNLEDPKLSEALNYFRELSYTAKAFTSWQGWSFSDFEAGNLPMMMERFGNKTASTEFSFDWDIVPFPVGPSGDPDTTPGTVGFYGIGAGSKNPTGGAAYIYLFCRQDYLKRGEYLRGYFTEEQAKLYEELQSKVEAAPALDGIVDPDKLMYDIMSGGDVAAKLQEYKPVWQAKLDDYDKAIQK